MPTQVNYPQIRPRSDVKKKATTFRDFSELRSALHSQSPEILAEGQCILFAALSFSNNF